MKKPSNQFIGYIAGIAMGISVDFAFSGNWVVTFSLWLFSITLIRIWKNNIELDPRYTKITEYKEYDKTQ
jgi:uncharacterized membrane protein